MERAGLHVAMPAGSSFVRKGEAGIIDPGTRPGLHGQSLISSGHSELDKILGGGIPLGSLTLVIEDGVTAHHAALLRLFLAEGATRNQSIFLAVGGSQAVDLASFLPAEASKIAGLTEDREKAEEDQQTLRIAWQYRRYLHNEDAKVLNAPTAAAVKKPTKKSSISLRDWCHTFDLLKPMGEQFSSANSGRSASIAVQGSLTPLIKAAETFVDSVSPYRAEKTAVVPLEKAFAHPRPLTGPHQVGRVGVLSLGAADWDIGIADEEASARIAEALVRIRALAQETRCAVFVTLPMAGHRAKHIALFKHVVDCVLQFEAVADDSGIVSVAPDSGSVAGTLRVVSLPGLGCAVPPTPEVGLYLVRNKRRRLVISAVEIDPLSEGAGGNATNMNGDSQQGSLDF